MDRPLNIGIVCYASVGGSGVVAQENADRLYVMRPIGKRAIPVPKGVTVAVKDRSVEVKGAKGTVSFAPRGMPPSEPRPIPPELLLSVFWPEPGHALEAGTVRGKTRPSSRVRSGPSGT